MDTTPNKNTDTFKVTGNWDQQSKLLKEKYAGLTDSDLKFEMGKENDIINHMSSRLNKKREEVISILNKTQVEKA